MIGLSAYKTYLGLSLHFRKVSSYDGWKYSFNGKCTEDTFEKNKLIYHRYAALENKYPHKNDQLRFFYPAFKKFGFCKANDIALFTRTHNQFMKELDDKFDSYMKEIVQLGNTVGSIDELLGVYEQVPTIYNGYIEELISFDSLVILSLVIPSINRIVSDDSYLWNSLNEKLKFDSKFYKLYIDDSKLKELQQNTISILSEIWKLKR